MTALGAGALTPEQWDATLSGPPILSTAPSWRHALLRQWKGTSPDMRQPPLDHHYVVPHLGGPKRVHRRGEGPPLAADIRPGELTVVPAGASFDWRTEGPIEFAHLYCEPRRLDRAVAAVFDRDPSAVRIEEAVGLADGHLQGLFASMLDAAGDPAARTGLYLESLLDAFLVRLLLRLSNIDAVDMRARYALAPHRLRKVLDYIEAHLAENVSLDDLAEVSGVSRFHFTRAFGRATGVPPYAYVTRRRVEAAKRLLRETRLPLAEIAQRCGFHSPGQFSTTFRNLTSATPSGYRDA
jgi:AraC family transcriptional regulator